MALIMKGAPVSESMRGEIIKQADALTEKGVRPCLGIIRVGERPDDLSYERAAAKRMAAMHIDMKVFPLPADIGQKELELEFGKINEDSSVHGILLFRPLPSHLDDTPLRERIDPYKDVDGMSPVNIAGVFAGKANCFAPCTPEAVMKTLDYYGITFAGKRAAVIGRSLVVGKPLAVLMTQRDATVTVCHTMTENLAEIVRSADIIAAAAGKAHLVTADMVRKGAVVADVGINVGEDGKVRGDADTEHVKEAAGAITPVPGGIGVVTSAVMAEHVLIGAEHLYTEKFGREIL